MKKKTLITLLAAMAVLTGCSSSRSSSSATDTSASKTEDAEETSLSSIPETVLVDDDNVKVTADKISYDNREQYPQLQLTVENKTSEDIAVTPYIRVNGLALTNVSISNMREIDCSASSTATENISLYGTDDDFSYDDQNELGLIQPINSIAVSLQVISDKIIVTDDHSQYDAFFQQNGIEYGEEYTDEQIQMLCMYYNPVLTPKILYHTPEVEIKAEGGEQAVLPSVNGTGLIDNDTLKLQYIESRQIKVTDGGYGADFIFYVENKSAEGLELSSTKISLNGTEIYPYSHSNYFFDVYYPAGAAGYLVLPVYEMYLQSEGLDGTDGTLSILIYEKTYDGDNAPVFTTIRLSSCLNQFGYRNFQFASPASDTEETVEIDTGTALSELGQNEADSHAAKTYDESTITGEGSGDYANDTFALDALKEVYGLDFSSISSMDQVKTYEYDFTSPSESKLTLRGEFSEDLMSSVQEAVKSAYPDGEAVSEDAYGFIYEYQMDDGWVSLQIYNGFMEFDKHA